MRTKIACVAGLSIAAPAHACGGPVPAFSMDGAIFLLGAGAVGALAFAAFFYVILTRAVR